MHLQYNKIGIVKIFRSNLNENLGFNHGTWVNVGSPKNPLKWTHLSCEKENFLIWFVTEFVVCDKFLGAQNCRAPVN